MPITTRRYCPWCRREGEQEVCTCWAAEEDVETECVRCCQPFTPVDDEQLCERCYRREYGPRR
jgi:predicted amidophosphoribosyltransferase